MNEEAKRVTELRDRLKDRDTYHDTLTGEETARVRELEQKWREEAAQRQTLQNSVREREEQLARTRLEYEDRVRQEEIRRAALEAQLQAVVPDTPSNINQQTPRDRGTQSSDHGSRTSHHSRRIRRTPTNSVAARLAQMVGATGGPSPSLGSLEGAVGYTNVPNSHGNHRGEGRRDGGHRDHGYHSRRDPSNRPSQQQPPSGPPSQNRPPSAPPSVSTITRGMETIRNVAPDAVYRGSHAVDPGAQYFAQRQPTGGSNVGANQGSNMDLGAVGNAPVPPPRPSRVMGQSMGSLSLGPGSGENEYYPEEVNRLNRSRPSHGIPSGSQTPTGYFTDTASETSYGTGSSVSRASRLGGPRVNPPRGAMGGNPPIPQRGLGFVPNILNPINPPQQPQGNIVPQGNNAQPNVPQPANARPVPVNNPAPPQPQVLPPAYRDYRLDNQPATPATPQQLWPVQAQPMHQPQDNPPPYAPYAGVPPFGQNPYAPYAGGVPQYGNPGGQGNPNWNILGGYHQPRQYQAWNPMGPFLPRPRDPKLSKYDGSLSWRAYEVKLEHMANQYGWDDGTKLAKLVEALEGKALNYYGTLDEVIRGNYRLVRQKFNARFFPREPARYCSQSALCPHSKG